LGECRLRALADRWRVEAEGWCTKLPGDVLRAVARELDEALDGLHERTEETEGDAANGCLLRVTDGFDGEPGPERSGGER
jgi:hypothetical protein